MELFKIKKWNNLPKNELIRVHLSMKLYHNHSYLLNDGLDDGAVALEC